MSVALARSISDWRNLYRSDFGEHIDTLNALISVAIVPAVLTMQLMAVDSSGTAQATVLFMRNVSGDCESLTQEFESDFVEDFERFIESVRAAN